VGGALVLVGLFYVVTVTAMTAGGTLDEDAPFLALARSRAPWLLHAVAPCALACIFSCFLAIHTTTARILYALGRGGALPAALGHTHPRWRSPHVAVAIQTLFTLGVGLPLGHWVGPGVNGAYGLTGAIGAVAIILVWILGNVSLMRDDFRSRGRFWLLRTVPPALSVLTLAYPLWATVASEDQPGQRYPSWLVPTTVTAWLLVGAVLYACVRDKFSPVGPSAAEPGEPAIPPTGSPRP
jgi:amino acid transporter